MNPCKDCTERHFKCHGECEKYKEWKSANAKEYKRDDATNFLVDNARKQIRRNKK